MRKVPIRQNLNTEKAMPTRNWKKPTLLLILMTCGGLMGCKETSVSVTSAQTARADYFVPLATPAGHTSAWDLYQEPDAVQHAANLEQIKAIGIAQTELIQGVKHAATWQEADELVREQLRQFQDHVLLHQLEQVAASNMLEYHLLGQAQAEDVTPLVAFYTEMLVRNSHPDSYLLARALEALKGTWGHERIAQYAQQTTAHAEHWLSGKVANLHDCTGADCLAKTLPEDDPMQVRAHQMLAALQTLQALR